METRRRENRSSGLSLAASQLGANLDGQAEPCRSRDSRYISNVLSLLREHRRFFLWTTLAALALRLIFFIYFPAITDDSRVYLDLAGNWLQHGVYGQTQLGKIVPSDTRLPGYPAFLAAIFAIFGSGNLRAVLITQILLDLGTCLIIADLARRVLGRKAGRVAFLLAALCPFLANYAAAVLTETLEIFFTTLALDCAAAALNCMSDRGKARLMCWRRWAASGAATGACILLRPDGGILLASLAFYLAILMARDRVAKKQVTSTLLAATTILVFALAPLVPWTIRNFRTLHHFQPLAPRYATESEDVVPRGFNRWVKTWIADYASVEEIYWNVPGDKIDVEKLPSRALDTARESTLAVIADYNQTQQLTPQLDARFATLAAECIRAHPVRYYIELPALRIADMWLRPRTALLPSDIRWWEFNDDPKWSALAVAFGALNLAYVAAALLTLVRRRFDIRYVGLLVCFLLLRSAFLGTIENPEPRYTMECYPVIIVLAAAFLATRGQKSALDRPREPAT
ncbi:MAG: glycosyltransferase family 39 protein [Terriglobales bacterium]